MKITSRNGLFVVADVVNGGGNFPVEGAPDIEQYQKQQRHQQKAERELRSRRRHCFTLGSQCVRVRA